MARSRGQIRDRGENKWLVRVYVGRVEGKRKYKSKMVTGTEQDAEEKLTEMLRKKDRGTLPKPDSEKLDAFLDEWLDMKEGTVAAGSLRNYKNCVEIHIKPALGHLKLDQVNSRLIQAMVNDLENEKDLSTSYIKLIHGTLRQALQQAVVWEMLPFNPAEAGRIQLPKDQGREYRIFKKGEIQAFLEAATDDPLYPLWVLLFTTGLRPQEALALKWGDLEDGWLQVQRVVRNMDPDGHDLGISEDMKTKRSRRRVKLPQATLSALKAHRGAQAQEMLKAGDRYERDGFIFADDLGHFLRPGMIRKAFNRTLEACGLPSEIRLYDIRHTHISHLIMDGVDLKKASARAGHSSINQTADTYAHLSEGAEEEMAEVAAGMVAGGSR